MIFFVKKILSLSSNLTDPRKKQLTKRAQQNSWSPATNAPFQSHFNLLRLAVR